MPNFSLQVLKFLGSYMQVLPYFYYVRGNERGGKMMLASDTKTASSQVQKGNARLSKLKSQLPFLSMFKKLF